MHDHRAISTYFSHLTKPYFYILFKPHLNHPGKCRVTQGRGKLHKIGPNKFMGGVGVWEGFGRVCVCGGIVGGRVRFVRYAFFTIKKCAST